MDIRKLQRAIVDGLEDVKAQNIQVFNTEHLSPLFERVIIASGTSNRQTKALASSVRETVKKRGLPVMRTEGEDNGEWIIVDCGAAVAHIMQPSIREYYHLEEIWGGKPVRMRIDAKGAVSLPKASEVESEDEAEEVTEAQRPAARKRPAKGASAASARKAAPAKPGARAAGKPTARAPAKPEPRSGAKTASKTGAKSGAKTGAKPSVAAPARKSAGSAARKPAVTRTTGLRGAASKTVVAGAPARKGAAAKGARRPR